MDLFHICNRISRSEIFSNACFYYVEVDNYNFLCIILLAQSLILGFETSKITCLKSEFLTNDFAWARLARVESIFWFVRSLLIFQCFYFSPTELFQWLLFLTPMREVQFNARYQTNPLFLSFSHFIPQTNIQKGKTQPPVNGLSRRKRCTPQILYGIEKLGDIRVLNYQNVIVLNMNLVVKQSACREITQWQPGYLAVPCLVQ